MSEAETWAEKERLAHLRDLATQQMRATRSKCAECGTDVTRVWSLDRNGGWCDGCVMATYRPVSPDEMRYSPEGLER